MECRSSKFGLGLLIGSVLGVMCYRFSCTPKAKQWKMKACEAMHKMGNHAEDMLDSAKEKAMNAGTKMADKVADKVADKSYDVAEKADDMKNKVHNFGDDFKK